MFKCKKGHTMVTEDRKTWTAFKTLVCHTCNREAIVLSFSK